MSSKKQTNNTSTRKPRVVVNTLLLLIATVIFAAISIYGYNSLAKVPSGAISNAPGICFDEKEDGQITENEYVCTRNDERVVEDQDFALFFYNEFTLTRAATVRHLMLVIKVVGSLFTVAGILSTIIYWNHNR